MSRPRGIPSYRRHKGSGQAIVTLTDASGRCHDAYLGAYGTAASRKEYARIIEEWEAAGRSTPPDSAVSTAKSSLRACLRIDLCGRRYTGAAHVAHADGAGARLPTGRARAGKNRDLTKETGRPWQSGRQFQIPTSDKVSLTHEDRSVQSDELPINTFDPIAWARTLDKDAPAQRPTLSPAAAARQARGRRLAQLLCRHEPWIVPELIDLLAEPLGELIGEIRGGSSDRP